MKNLIIIIELTALFFFIMILAMSTVNVATAYYGGMYGAYGLMGMDGGLGMMGLYSGFGMYGGLGIMGLYDSYGGYVYGRIFGDANPRPKQPLQSFKLLFIWDLISSATHCWDLGSLPGA